MPKVVEAEAATVELEEAKCNDDHSFTECCVALPMPSRICSLPKPLMLTLFTSRTVERLNVGAT